MPWHKASRIPKQRVWQAKCCIEDCIFKYDTLVSVLENEFEKELPSPLPERLSPILLKNKAVQSVFDKYELSDDFGASPEYEKLYTELTGTIVLIIEVNGLPTIGGENMT